MLTACSATLTGDLASCTGENAMTVIRVPTECATPAICFMNAKAYLAQTSLGRELGPDDQVKIICSRWGAIATAPY
jgi:surface antigen